MKIAVHFFPSLTCLLFLGTVCGPVSAQKIPLGAPAPSVGTAKSVQGKSLAGFEKGKVYVLEFWATWCGSCRPAMAHLDALATTFAGKPVEIYSVSDEKGAKVEPFLKRFPMKTNVVSEAGGLFERFGVQLLPSTVLIDKAGNVAAFTKPEAVTETVLNALLEDRPISLPVASDKPADLHWDKEIVANSVGHVLLRFADSDNGGSRFVPNSGQITADGITPLELFLLANNASRLDLRWNAPSEARDETRYRISVKAADGKDATARAMLGDALTRTFALRSEWQDTEREVYVLRTKGAVKLAPSTGPSNEGGARAGSIVWADATSKVLADLVATYGLNKTVVDETGLTGHYNLLLEWTPGDRDSCVKALAGMGLELTKETRKVPTLVISAR